MRRDLPTMTRNGADPWFCWVCGGNVVVCVPVGGPGFSVCPGACANISGHAGSDSAIETTSIPTMGLRTLIFEFLSL
jgi:hypothetical protein